VSVRPLSERRAVLLQNMTEVKHRVHFSEMKEIHKPDDLRAMIARVLSEGLEGLVLKDIKSIYEPGKRHWLKVRFYILSRKCCLKLVFHQTRSCVVYKVLTRVPIKNYTVIIFSTAYFLSNHRIFL
jgi:ATP-dependent DNA ligase